MKASNKCDLSNLITDFRQKGVDWKDIDGRNKERPKEVKLIHWAMPTLEKPKYMDENWILKPSIY